VPVGSDVCITNVVKFSYVPIGSDVCITNVVKFSYVPVGSDVCITNVVKFSYVPIGSDVCITDFMFIIFRIERMLRQFLFSYHSALRHYKRKQNQNYL